MSIRSFQKVSILLLLVATVVSRPLLRASDFYEWTDENGVTHFVDSLEQVPAKYRDQIKTPPPRPKAPPQAEPTPRLEPRPIPGATAPTAPVEASGSGMKRFEVPYENEGQTARIILPVTFNDRVTARVALDTGSPGLVISIDLADRLGLLSRNNGTLLIQAAGIGGTSLAIRTIVDSVSVQDARAVFVPTTVVEALSPAFEGLVGMDFLAGHSVHIDSGRRVVTFEERPPDPDARGGHDEAWWRRTFAQFRSARDGWEAWKEQASSENRRIKAPVLEVVDFQIREAEKLLMRLEVYASEKAVPRHWR